MKDRIREIRKSKHLTQQEFGESLGVSGAAISKIEVGDNIPSGALVKLICSTYHVNYLWLTEGEGPMQEAMNTDDLVDLYMAGESEVTRSIMKAFAKLPDAEWVKLRDLIQKIKNEGR